MKDRAWIDYIKTLREDLEGCKIEYQGKIYTVAAIDYNGMVHIDKPTEHNTTTAVYGPHEARKHIEIAKVFQTAQRIYDYTDPWNREQSVEEIAETIKTDPETVISYLMDIIEELTS